jgi:transposase
MVKYKISPIVLNRVGCFAHARRYYKDALKILPKEAEIELTHAHKAILYFRELIIFYYSCVQLSKTVRRINSNYI